MAHTHYRTKAIVLKKEDKGEADQLLTVLSEQFGKIEVLAKAIRKIKSKLRSSSGLFFLSEIEFIQGKSYKILTDSVIINRFNQQRWHSDTLKAVCSITEMLDSLLGQAEKDDKVWLLLKQTFEWFSCSKKNSPELVALVFFWQLVAILGYSPQLYQCAHCQKKLLPETMFFAPQEGGIVCWQCFAALDKEEANSNRVKGREINPDTVKATRFFLRNPLPVSIKLKMGSSSLLNLAEISQFYLNFLKERYGICFLVK